MNDPRKYNRRQSGNVTPGVAVPTYKQAKSQNKRPSRGPNTTEKPAEMTPEMRKLEKRKAAQRKMVLNNIRRVVIIMAIVIAISVSIAVFVISCVNDVLAIHINPKRDNEVSVVIAEDMNTDDVIDALDDAGVIRNAWFCKLAAKIIGYSDEGYIARTYDFKPSMGLENMLNEIKNKTSETAKTVTLTFPEGYSADQIIAMLEENNVCSREKFVATMNTVDFSKDFDFLESITKPESRYMRLEGFLFPDTYEFYIGEDPESVIKKFLGNFDRKWTDSYTELAEDRGMTVDQIINLASIVEKEAVGADMPVVGSILFNRIDANMRLECDSTSIYIKNNLSGLSETDIAAYNALYDTYSCYSLPVGAICNPGVDAISAVLNAPDTGYYYFIHDRNNEFHVAKTLSEQEYNIRTYGLAQ